MEDLDLIRSISFFKGLTTGELIKVTLLTEDVTFSEGDEIIREGAPCDALYIVKAGSVRVMKEGSHLETVEAGEPLGEMAFIDRGPRSASVIAGKDAALIKLPAEPFEKLLAMDKDLAGKIYRGIIKVLCKRLREATEALKIIPDYVMDPHRNYDNI